MSRLREMLSRLRGLLPGNRLDARLEEEIGTHLDLLAAEYERRGFNPQDALAAARREFGAIQQMREAYRDRRTLPLIDSISQDVRYAWRTLIRRPGFSLAAIGILALGIGPNVAVFSVVDAVLFRALPFRDPARLVQVAGTSIHNPASLVIIRRDSRLAEYASWGSGAQANLTGQGEPARIVVSSISGNLFDVLGVSPLRGRRFTLDEETPGRDKLAIISYALWKSRFGSDPGVVGQSMRLDDSIRRIVGVMPPEFRFPSPDVEAWVPAVMDPRNDGFYWWSFSLTVLGRLHPGVGAGAAQSEVRQLIPRIRDGFPWKMWPDWGADTRVVSLQEALTANARRRFLILFGSVLLVLLITCGNLASLMLSRGIARGREIATRTALGAGRWRILRQLLTEGLLLSGIGAAIGIGLAFVLQALLARVLPADPPRINEIAINGRVLLFTAATALLTALAFSAIPALLLMKTSLHGTVHSAARVTGSRTCSALVTVEVALAVVLVTAAGLMGRSLGVLSGISTGFRSDHLLTATVSPNESTCRNFGGCPQFFAQLLNDLRAIPGMELASAANTLPLTNDFSAFAAELQDHPQRPGHDAPMLWMSSATADYLRAMGIPVLRGRGFTDLDGPNAEPVIIVSAATAEKWWPGQDPLGKHIRPTWLKPWRKVVGVVPDIQTTTPGQPFGKMQGQTYIPYAQALDRRPDAVLSLVLRVSGDPLTYMQELRRRVRSLSPDVPVTSIRTMDEVVRASLSTPRGTLWLLFCSAALALALGVAGIYSVVSWNVSRRIPEIGVRMALGATPGDVSRMILRRTTIMAGTGVCIGIAAALPILRMLRSIVYGVSTYDPATFVLAGAVLFATGLLAGYVPARRAARVDPLSALRCD